MRTLAAIATVALALSVAACGDDDGGTGTTTDANGIKTVSAMSSGGDPAVKKDDYMNKVEKTCRIRNAQLKRDVLAVAQAVQGASGSVEALSRVAPPMIRQYQREVQANDEFRNTPYPLKDQAKVIAMADARDRRTAMFAQMITFATNKDEAGFKAALKEFDLRAEEVKKAADGYGFNDCAEDNRLSAGA